MFHKFIPPLPGCIWMSRLGTVNNTTWFSPQCRQKAALETQMDVWLSKVLLQWQLHITHALILIVKYILYIIAIFIYVLEYFSNWVSLSMVLVYKTVFLKPTVGKGGIIHMTFGIVLLKVRHCFNFIFIIISLKTIVCLEYFPNTQAITPFHKYQPESLELLNITTSAFRQPVFVYRFEKCMYNRL